MCVRSTGCFDPQTQMPVCEPPARPLPPIASRRVRTSLAGRILGYIFSARSERHGLFALVYTMPSRRRSRAVQQMHASSAQP